MYGKTPFGLDYHRFNTSVSHQSNFVIIKYYLTKIILMLKIDFNKNIGPFHKLI